MRSGLIDTFVAPSLPVSALASGHLEQFRWIMILLTSTRVDLPTRRLQIVLSGLISCRHETHGQT